MAEGRRETANKLKPIITEPRVRVNEKHRAPYYIENATNLMAFTNWMNAIPIENGDRRYLVLASPAKPRPPSYYDGLFGRLRGDGPGVALGFLMARDISKFDGLGRAPETGGKEAMRRASMGDVEHHLLECFENGAYPLHGDLTSVADLVDALPERARRVSGLHNLVGQFLRNEVGAVSLGQHRLSSGARKVLWSVRRHEMVASATAPTRARIYEASMAEGATGGGRDDAASDFDDMLG